MLAFFTVNLFDILSLFPYLKNNGNGRATRAMTPAKMEKVRM